MYIGMVNPYFGCNKLIYCITCEDRGIGGKTLAGSALPLEHNPKDIKTLSGLAAKLVQIELKFSLWLP
jgi:hypothetical protein